MFVYITGGTFDFLKKIEAKYPGEKIYTMQGNSGSLLFHETQGETVFKQPRRYEIIGSSGDITKKAFAAMYNIPVSHDDRPVLEDWLKKRARKLAAQQGLNGLRLLRPLSSNTYIVMTIWENELSFHQWKNSDSFFEANEAGGLLLNDPQTKIFASGPYFSEYYITE